MLEGSHADECGCSAQGVRRGCYPDGESASGEPPDRLVEPDGRYRGLHRGGLRHLHAPLAIHNSVDLGNSDSMQL
jgi:hypothetical protein